MPNPTTLKPGMRVRDPMRMPLGFKLWFAFVGTLVAAGFALAIYLTFSLASMGPEGIGQMLGRAAGQFAQGVQQGAQESRP